MLASGCPDKAGAPVTNFKAAVNALFNGLGLVMVEEVPFCSDAPYARVLLEAVRGNLSWHVPRTKRP